MRSLFLCVLILSGCASPQQPNSVEAIAEQKRQAHLERKKQNDEFSKTVRLAARRVYLQDHPELSPDIRNAILNERVKKGMSAWQVMAAYSLWNYSDHPSAAKYRAVGAMPLWALADRHQATEGPIQREEWKLQQEDETQYLYFENGVLTKVKD